MKKLVFLLSCFTIAIHAQEAKKKEENSEKKEFVVDSTKVLTLDKTIKTLYDVISAEKEEERNWKQFKFLFYPDAKLIPTGMNQDYVYKAKYLTPQEYIKNSQKWLKMNGFIEKEIYRTVNTFGNIAHVFSTYESFYSKKDEKPFMRGINSIQLIYDEDRWWIVNIFWAQETEEQPIPKAHLPRKNK
ncbi:hypothetical protein SAMN05421824_2494 [Hyunsoonleella jejuensis]|uniref:SnoaL-like domain-containing protein n=1 Tax=Hyunsoonleella jejuensis TaxID=419940 RepID=A0A1H9JEY6_9FLAO|nr:hypothetical protein [Hyunsoonleella jejuensis]SEQ85402.1 hypothetical protein SAMN05421824_2494 [Hyunsoonleella jejuensis]